MFFSINKESHQPIGSMIIVDDFPHWFVFLEMCLVQIFMATIAYFPSHAEHSLQH
jgi:hypothetical protein